MNYWARSVFILCILFFTHQAFGQVKLLVKVPSNTPLEDTLYIAGSFNQWKPNDVLFKLKKEKGNLYSVVLPKGIDSFEYKVTRGSWKSVECLYNGRPSGNRIRHKNQKKIIQIEIQNWEDLATKDATLYTFIVENVPNNTPKDANIYITGDFNGWYPGDTSYQLERINEQYVVTLPIIPDTVYYKFTRGSWTSVEARRNGRALPNRRLIKAQQQENILYLKIIAWEDLHGGMFNFYTILLLIGAVQGIFVWITLYFIPQRNKKSNNFLSLASLILTITVIGRIIVYDREVFQTYPQLILIQDFALFLYSPLLFLYFSSLIHKSSSKTGYHFIPFILHFFSYLPLLFMERDFFINRMVNHQDEWFFGSIGAIAMIHNTFYCYRLARLVYQKPPLFLQHLLFYKRSIVFLITACLSLWYFTYIIGGISWFTKQDFYWLTDKTTDATWLLFAWFPYLFSYFLMLYPSLFKFHKVPSSELASSISDKEMNQEFIKLKKKLCQVMTQEKLYTDPELTLAKLAEAINTNSHTLSKVINEGYEENFHTFINRYRVGEFKKLLVDQNYKNYTFLALALKVGFNSKTAFNRAFKKITGNTPREYLNSIQTKEVKA